MAGNQDALTTATSLLLGGGAGGGTQAPFLETQDVRPSELRPSIYTPASDDTETSIQNARKSTLIPSNERLTLSWKRISLRTIPKGLGKHRELGKEILSDVAGIAHAGALMAVMGASGAGKTSLLNILNFRTKSTPELKINGSVMLNGHIVDANDMSTVSVFVQQDDVFTGALTCREHLEFHATLRMKIASNLQKKERVEQVLDEMGLRRCENVKIGDSEEKGISGGEAKRLSFATEILNRPPLIFCDEPTSGLDSYMARGLVKLLKRYAGAGRTILCTIHQPSSELFALFDYICIMAEGKCAYIGKAEGCLQSFNAAGFPCPETYNPFDHYIFTLAVIPGREDQCRKQVKQVTDAYRESEAYSSMIKGVDQIMKFPLSEPWWCEDNDAVMSCILGLTWMKINIKRDSSITNVPGAVFSFITFTIFSAMMILVMVIPLQTPVIARDYLSGVYKIPTYYVSVTIFHTIDILISTAINSSIVFWMIFANTAIETTHAFPRFLGALQMAALVGIAMGMLFSSIASTYEQATSFVTLSVIFMIYAGFLIPQDEISPLFKIFQWLSCWFYSQELVMWYIYYRLPQLCKYGGAKLEYQDKLEEQMVLEKANRDQEKIKNIMAHMCNGLCDSSNPESDCCDNFLSGRDHLARYQLEERVVRDMAALTSLMAGFHIIALIVLSAKMHFKKKG